MTPGTPLPAPAPNGEALLRERVKLLCEQSVSAVGSVLVGCLLIAVILATRWPWWVAAAWVLAFLGVNSYRLWLSKRLLRSGALPARLGERRFTGFAVFNGVWTGALPLLFFDRLPVEARLALTVMILLTSAGGVASYASHPRGYRWFVLISLPPLAFEWGLQGESYWAVAFTILLYGVVMVRFSTNLSNLFERSVMIRFEREAVVEALRVEQAHTEYERRRAEDANRAKSQFLANASHDLRQPTQALALYTAVLQRNASTDEHRQIAQSIAQASRALGELLDDLLDVSRLDAGAVLVHPQAVDLAVLVEQLRDEADRVGREKGLAVQARCPELVLRTDPVLLQRLLRNLLHNALKFTERGGISMEVSLAGRDIRFAVADTGCGIAPDQQGRIFEEFFQLDNPERDRSKGLGLGLAIVARLAQLLGGRIDVVSQPGEGSVFTFTMPSEVGPPLRVAHPAIAEAPAPDLRGRKLLVVEDDAMVRGALCQLLETWGADVDAHEGLVGALGCERGWDLALCDLRLRSNEDGIETAAALCARRPGMPIVLITGDTAPERIEQATRTGHVLLHKPVSETQLAHQLRALLA